MGGYFLKSARLGFRTWTGGDLELAWGLFGDPEISRFVGGPFTREQVREWLGRHMAWQEEAGVQYWPLFLLETGEFAGCCGLRPRPEPRSYELGFYIMRAFQRRGYAGEAARAALACAFGGLKAEAVYAGHHPRNAASRAALAGLGFADLRDELYPPTGLAHPLYVLNKS